MKYITTKKKQQKYQMSSKNKKNTTKKRKRHNKKTNKKRKNTKGGQGDTDDIKKLFGRSYSIQDVNYDGDCMYHSILRATREQGKEPGILRNKKGEYWTPKDLRQYLVENISNYSDIKEHYGDMLPTIINEIKGGITNPSYSRNWGSQPIVEFVNRIFGVDIQIVDKSTWKIISAGGSVTDETILLLWINGQHYMWLKKEQENHEHSTHIPIIEMLTKKEGEPQYYIIQDNAMSDEELVNIIRSTKSGDMSIDTLDNKKQSALYYAGKNFGLPVVKALIDAGAVPNTLLRGVKVIGDETVYDGETVLDLLAKQYKHLLDDKLYIETVLKYNMDDPKTPEPWFIRDELRQIKNMKAPSPALNMFPRKHMVKIEQQTIKKNLVELAIKKELERLGPIIDYLIPLTTTNVNKRIKNSEKMKNEPERDRWKTVAAHPTQYLHYRYDKMKKSDLSNAIKEHDVEKVKSIIDSGVDVNQIQSDNPREKLPIFEALDQIENVYYSPPYEGYIRKSEPKSSVLNTNVVKIIKILIDAGATMNSQISKAGDKDTIPDTGFINTLIIGIGIYKYNENDFNNDPIIAYIYEDLLQYAFQRGAKPEPYEETMIWYSDDDKIINPDDYINNLYTKCKK